MSSACLGVLLLGVCVPVPGMPERAVRELGWEELPRCGTTVEPEDEPAWAGWSGATRPSAWRRRLIADAAGDGAGVRSVFLVEFDDEAVVERALRPHCSWWGEPRACVVAGRAFCARRCGPAWLWERSDQRDESPAWCEQYGELLAAIRPAVRPPLVAR